MSWSEDGWAHGARLTASDRRIDLGVASLAARDLSCPVELASQL